MNKWQKYWLYFVGTIFLLHFIRDICQDLGLPNILSTYFVKTTPNNLVNFPWYWWIFNTYIFELTELIIVIICLKRNRFGKLGYLSIGLLTIIFSAWLYYWNFL